MPVLIHFAIISESKTIEATCGSWDTGVNWTTMRKLVTCPGCLARLATPPRPQPRPSGPPKAV